MFKCVLCQSDIETDEDGIGVNALSDRIVVTPVSAGDKHLCLRCVGQLKGGHVLHPAYASLAGTHLVDG